MRRLLQTVLLACTTLGLVVVDKVPVPRAPAICKLHVAGDLRSHDVVVTWEGGTDPFDVVRADGPCFGRAKEIRFIARKVKGRRFVDHGALRTGQRFWYQVFDGNSGKHIWKWGPSGDTEDCGNEAPCEGEERPRAPATWP